MAKSKSKTLSFFSNLEKAVFLKRLNRFLILCRQKRKKIKAFLPNPGRLWELLLPKAKIYLEKSSNFQRKFLYTAVAVERENYPIIINTLKANDIAKLLLRKNLIPGLEGMQIIKREYVYGRSRFDFYLEKGGREIILEVKSCTLYGKRVAMFPDAVTTRGRKHLQELREFKEKGKEGAILFLIFSPTAKYFLPEYHTDPDFAQLLFDAKDEISIFPVAIKFQNHFAEISQVRTLPVPWDILARENRNRGAYILILHLPAPKSLPIGSLGQVYFPAGYYLYVGSAEKNLAQRISRHRRRRKKFFWHIDYFLEHAQFYKSLPIRTSLSIECDLARALSKISSWEIPRFGSSDCSCQSHLLGVKKDPLENPEFISILQHFRMDRIFTNPKE